MADFLTRWRRRRTSGSPREAERAPGDRGRGRPVAAYARARRQPIDPDTVLLESFAGHGHRLLCNPHAIARHLLERPDLAHLRQVHVVDDLAAADEPADDRVRLVERGTPAYFEALATAGHLVNNATFPAPFAKRAGQVYLNTWHGVPLKAMGYDLPGGPEATRNILRNLVAADVVLSTGPWMTDGLYRRAFRLEGIFEGVVLEEGQPRTDLQQPALAPTTRRLLADRGIDLDDRRVVLLAPTWRGPSYERASEEVDDLLAAVARLRTRLGERWTVLLKVHQVVHDRVAARLGSSAAGVLVPGDVDANLVLGVTDVLVTDYSSIFFDFLPTGRPLVFHTPDLDDYTSGRGLALAPADLPGPVTRTLEELTDAVGAAARSVEQGAGPPTDRAAHVERFTPHDDGDVTRRVVDAVFLGSDEARRVDLSGDRPRLLVYLGGLRDNGITTSALSLLRALDHDRFDVSASYHYGGDPDTEAERRRNAARIDPRVRVFPRIGGYVGPPDLVAAVKQQLLEGLPSSPEGTGPLGGLPPEQQEVWATEWRRLFGDTTFDHLLDLSGYGNFCPFLHAAAPRGHRSTWLHNDLAVDAARETEGERHLEDRLQAVFTTYRTADRLVSVSPALRDINARNLAAHADPQRFVHARNTIDAHRVRAAAAAPLDPAHAAFLAGATPGQVLVTVGRLSPAKNHARLVEAFAAVAPEHPGARLVVVGGGPLAHDLESRVRDAGLEARVLLTGALSNPFPVLAAGDCFVLSSDYEGQPMVILEARVLGLPVLTTAFGSVEDALPDGAGTVVPATAEALADGIRDVLRDPPGRVPFDDEAYNAAAVAEVLAAIEAAPPR